MDEKTKKAIEMYQDGAFLHEVAEHLGVTTLTARRRLKGHLKFRTKTEAMELRRQRKWTPEKVAQIVQEYRDGLAVAQLVRNHSTNHRTILKILREHKVDRRTQSEQQTGEGNAMWNGGSMMSKGYRHLYQPDHPLARRGSARTVGGYVAEHRLVMEKKLGRYLTKDEVVHHIDKNPLNNHPDNLMLFATNAEHLAHELKGQCPNWSEDGKRRIREAIRKPRSRKK